MRASGYLMLSLTLTDRLDGLGRYLSWLRQSLGWAGVALVLAGAALAARGLLAPRRLTHRRASR